MAGQLRAKQLRDDTFDATQVGAKFATGSFTLANVNDLFDAASIALSKLEEAVIQADGGQAFTADQSMGGFKLTNGAAGTAATDFVIKSQLDAIAAGLDPKESARAATTGLLSAISTTPVYAPTGGASGRGQLTFTAGPTTVDGVTLANDDRILVKNESSGTAEVHSVDTVADVGGSLNNTFFVFYTTPNLGFYVWFNVSAGGTDPTPAAPAGVTFEGIEVAIATNDTSATVASAIKTAIDAFDFTNKGGSPTVVVAGAGSDEITITNAEGGDVTDVADGSAATGFTFATDTQGTGLGGAANGIWVRTGADTWDRAADFDTDAEVTAGAYLPIEEGTSNGDKLFLLTTNDPITIGGAAGTPLTFNSFGSLNLGGTPTTIEPDDAANEGVSSTAARSDHTHAIATEAPVAVGTANSEGVATSFARSDHVHDSPAPTTDDKNLTPAATTGDAQDTTLDITNTPALDGDVGIFVNNLGPYNLANGDGERATADCYFSDDGGTTAKTKANIAAGDSLYWNGVQAGFDLDTIDRFDFVYEV